MHKENTYVNRALVSVTIEAKQDLHGCSIQAWFTLSGSFYLTPCRRTFRSSCTLSILSVCTHLWFLYSVECPACNLLLKWVPHIFCFHTGFTHVHLLLAERNDSLVSVVLSSPNKWVECDFLLPLYFIFLFCEDVGCIAYFMPLYTYTYIYYI